MSQPVVVFDEYDAMHALAWSSDGRLLAGRTDGTRMLVWGGSTYKVLHDVKDAPLPQAEGKGLVAIALANKMLFAAYEDVVLKLEVETGVWSVLAEVGGTLTLAPGGGRLLIGRVHLVDVADGSREELREYPDATAYTLVSNDILLRAYYTAEDNMPVNAHGHYERIDDASRRSISFVNVKLGTVAADDIGGNTVPMYQTPYGQMLCTADKGRCFAREQGEGATLIEAWKSKGGKQWTQAECDLRGESMSLSRDGTVLAVLHEGEVVVYGTARMTELKRFTATQPPPGKAPVPKWRMNRYVSLALNPDGRRVALGDKAGKVEVGMV